MYKIISKVKFLLIFFLCYKYVCAVLTYTCWIWSPDECSLLTFSLTIALSPDLPHHILSWVRRELHCWVYDNLRAKWPGVLRRPTRLPGLFSGYHTPSGLVAAVLRAVGVRLEDLTAEVAAAGVRGMLLLW